MTRGSQRPLIGVTTHHRETEGRPRFMLPAAYVDAVREAGGLAVLLAPGETAIERAICRGLQVLNAARGGTLHAHLPETIDHAVAHRLNQDAAVSHGVEIEPTSRLSEILRADALGSVPSWHHQSISEVGEGLKAEAFAADGVIEAIELVEERPLLAVQWHPELEAPGADGRRVFDQLVAWAGPARS